MYILFLTPPLDGPATGGTLYNKQLMAALTAAEPHDLTFEQRSLEALPHAMTTTRAGVVRDTERRHAVARAGAGRHAERASAITLSRAGVCDAERGHTLERAELGDAERAQHAEARADVGRDTKRAHGEARADVGRDAERVDQVWVDSLYLSALPDLRARFDRETQLGLLLHYLPSLLDAPQLRTAAELNATELRALQAADLILTPSEFLQRLIGEICPGKRCACVTPGVQVTQPGGASVRDGSALMISNVTENKGVLPFLHALAQVVQPAATFELAIAGDLQLEAAYAQDCLALCEQHPWLREHVRFLGSISQAELFARLAHASVLVSASRMESYGMALAEARALGTPILALPGGNIAHHVAAESGGQLAGTPHELARALCALTADPGELTARLTRARAAANVRPWSAAAADFVALAVQARER